MKFLYFVLFSVVLIDVSYAKAIDEIEKINKKNNDIISKLEEEKLNLKRIIKLKFNSNVINKKLENSYAIQNKLSI
ncbi:MAG: hypothetical protein M0R46_09860 [Candidatus Muirbacterium halophilum]|nr:hypothetical protein [Candidatus Muirbacterium halophilum]